MKLAYGTTRLVILIGTFAIKVPCQGPWWFLKRFLHHLKHHQVQQTFSKFTGIGLKQPGMPRFFILGTTVNYTEYKVWRKSRSQFVVPTFFSLFGLINIQARGEQITEEELRASHPFPHLLNNESVDHIREMNRAENFCRYQGRICLLDYGRYDTAAMLSKKKIGNVHTQISQAQLN